MYITCFIESSVQERDDHEIDKCTHSSNIRVVSIDIGTQSAISTQDFECQFNYLTPSLGMSLVLSILL